MHTAIGQPKSTGPQEYKELTSPGCHKYIQVEPEKEGHLTTCHKNLYENTVIQPLERSAHRGKTKEAPLFHACFPTKHTYLFLT